MDKKTLAATIESRIYESPKTYDSVRYLCYEAKAYGFHSVQVFPNMIGMCAEILEGSDVKICALGAYPHGGMTIEQKAFEAKDSVSKGAAELDIVINTREIKNRNRDYLIREMKAVRQAVPDAVVKFNIEIEYLNREEIALACDCAKEAGIDCITTSTGLYHIADENLQDVPLTCKAEDIAYIRQCLAGSSIQIQACGYIGSAQLARELLDAGADRIATEYALDVMKSC